MATVQDVVTAEEFRQFAAVHDGLVELVRGESIEMTRPGKIDGILCARLSFVLMNWCTAQKVGRVMTNDVGPCMTMNPDSVRGPDVMFVRAERLSADRVDEGWLEIVPDLCVEILSPLDRWPVVLERISEYFRMGVPEVWVLDPETRQVQVQLSDAPAPVVYDMDGELTSPHLPGFKCRVAGLFEGC